MEIKKTMKMPYTLLRKIGSKENDDDDGSKEK